MGSLKNWAKLYEMRTGTYEGLGGDVDTRKVMEDIEEQGGKCSLVENGADYCAEAEYGFGEKKTWCVDSDGFDGKGKCSSGSVKCY